MFVLDSLFISGLRWVLDKVVTAADAELNDDSVLREELLAAEMRREMGEISDEEFAAIEADLLSRMRAIKVRREGGSGPVAFGRDRDAVDADIRVEATVAGDFHDGPPADGGAAITGHLVDRPAGRQRRARLSGRHTPARPARRSRPAR